MARAWRLLDTGLRSAAQNIALDRALLEARRADEIPTTLRFFRFTESALLGLQQSAAQELDADYCREQGIPIQRRVSGAPARIAGPDQLDWALYVNRCELGGADLRASTRRLTHAVATAISALGIDARLRERDEIEIEARSVGECGFAADGDAVIFTGTIFCGRDFDRLVRAIRLPAAHAPEHLRAAAETRMTDLNRALGAQVDLKRIREYIAEALESDFDAEFSEGELTMSEEARYRAALPEIDTADWVNMVARPVSEAPRRAASVQTAAGTLRAALVFDAPTRTLKRIWLSGDFGIEPRRALLDLEAALRDVPLDRVLRSAEWFFGSHAVTTALKASDVAAVVASAVGRPLTAQNT